jgi:hypothetical protein
VLLFVGDSLGLRDHTEAHQTNPGQRASRAAELAAGAITYSSQQHQPRPVRQADLQPQAELTDGPVHLGGNFTRHIKHIHL